MKPFTTTMKIEKWKDKWFVKYKEIYFLYKDKPTIEQVEKDYFLIKGNNNEV